MLNGSHRRYELSLKLGADTWQDLLEALRQLRIDLNSLPTNGAELERALHNTIVAEAWSMRVDVAFDHAMTHERYYRELAGRLDALDRLMDEAETEAAEEGG